MDRLPAWKRLIDHPAYDDYWQDQALDKQLAKVSSKVPTLTVHSLFDQEDIYGPLASYAALAKKDRKKTQDHTPGHRPLVSRPGQGRWLFTWQHQMGRRHVTAIPP